MKPKALMLQHILLISLVNLLAVLAASAETDPCKGTPLTAQQIKSGMNSNSGCPTGLPLRSSPELLNATTLKIPAPKNAEDKVRLGLSKDAETFTLAELDADLLLILVFDMYCHVCRQSAENMNWLVQEIESNPTIKDVKILGLGRGDTDFEVQTFKKKLGLDFPAASDRDKKVTDAMGARRTPAGYLLCRKTGEYRIISTFEGYLSSSKAKEFLAPLN